jgi:hypothetical protein
MVVIVVIVMIVVIVVSSDGCDNVWRYQVSGVSSMLPAAYLCGIALISTGKRINHTHGHML